MASTGLLLSLRLTWQVLAAYFVNVVISRLVELCQVYRGGLSTQSIEV